MHNLYTATNFFNNNHKKYFSLFIYPEQFFLSFHLLSFELYFRQFIFILEANIFTINLLHFLKFELSRRHLQGEILLERCHFLVSIRFEERGLPCNDIDDDDTKISLSNAETDTHTQKKSSKLNLFYLIFPFLNNFNIVRLHYAAWLACL